MIVLRRGDRIHLAIPLNGRIAQMSPLEQVEAGNEQADFFIREYAAQGVEVVICGGNTSLNVPVVVAVFRDTE